MNYLDAAMPEISAGVRDYVAACERECAQVFAALDEIENYNTQKVLLAFQRHRVALRHFAPTNGYGYDDIGRDTLDRLYADVFGAEDALVRPQIASGTHALALCLQGLTRPGGKLLAASGRPYDTLEPVSYTHLTLREGGIFKDGFNEQLDKYRMASRDGKGWLSQLEAREREKTGIKTLKIGFNRVFGYYLEVTKSYLDKVPMEYVRKQTLANCERYTTQELKEIENNVLGSEEKAVQLEYNLFIQLREVMLTQIDSIKSTANALKQLDCILSRCV